MGQLSVLSGEEEDGHMGQLRFGVTVESTLIEGWLHVSVFPLCSLSLSMAGDTTFKYFPLGS